MKQLQTVLLYGFFRIVEGGTTSKSTEQIMPGVKGIVLKRNVRLRLECLFPPLTATGLLLFTSPLTIKFLFISPNDSHPRLLSSVCPFPPDLLFRLPSSTLSRRLPPFTFCRLWSPFLPPSRLHFTPAVVVPPYFLLHLS